MTGDWEAVDYVDGGVVHAGSFEGNDPLTLRMTLSPSAMTLRTVLPTREGDLRPGRLYRAEDCPAPPSPSSGSDDHQDAARRQNQNELWCVWNANTLFKSESRGT